jgi:Protein of unknown function (DUF2892)
MQCNVGDHDRILRISVGILLVILALTNVIGTWGWIGLIPIATGIFRFCPAYPLLDIKPCKKS